MSTVFFRFFRRRERKFATAPKLDQLSVRRWGEGEDVANLCLFLAGDLSGYITGALLDVSGGKFATQDPGAAWRSL